MSKRAEKHQLSDKKKTNIVIIVSIVLAIINFVPFHYSRHYDDCPHGGSYTESGVRLGVPVPYAGTIHGQSTCPGVYSDVPSKGFSVGALFIDALVFGIVMVGLNMLLDRRTKQ